MTRVDRQQITSRLRLAAMLLPACTIIGVLFMGGMILGVLQSLGYGPLLGQTRLTLQAYIDLLTAPAFFRSLALTAWIALASTLLSTLLATLCALALRRNFAAKRLVMFIFQLKYLLNKLGSCGRSPDRVTAGTVRRPARASLPRFIEMIPTQHPHPAHRRRDCDDAAPGAKRPAGAHRLPDALDHRASAVSGAHL